MTKNLIAGEAVIGPPFEGYGPLGLEGGGDAPTIFASFISTIVGFLTIISFIYFVVSLFSGALGIITSGGDKGRLESARSRITSGLVGLVVVIAAIFIIDLIGSLFGIPILNIVELINRITP